MTDQIEQRPNERTADERGQGLTGADVLAILAVSSFLAAIGLTTFFVTAALAH